MASCKLLTFALAASLIFLPQCSEPKIETFTSGEFSFDYPSDSFEITAREMEGKMDSFILYSEKMPFNRIEFAVYRYDPEFVATIVPSELMGELKVDVIQMSHRATDGLEIKSQEGRISPEEFPTTQAVDNLMTVSDTTGTEAIVRVSSMQMMHYNVIAVAWSATPEAMDSLMNIYSTFKVREPAGE